MKKARWLLVAALLALTASTAALAAVNVKQLPTATFDGASVTVTGGNFSGLGNVPAFAVVTVSGLATYTCSNQGGNEAPGQNPVPATGGSSPPVDLGNSDHNGRGTIPSITTSVTAPPTPSPQVVGCGGKGSGNWTVTLHTLTATAAHLVIRQPVDGPIIFCRDYVAGGSNTGTPCP